MIAFSLVPDLDVLPGILFGNISAFHNHMTHSPVFGLAVCAGYSTLRFRLPSKCRFGRTFRLTSCAYGLHLVMDYMTYSRGQMIFWPFSDKRFKPPLVLFYGLRRSDGWLTTHHLYTFITESFQMIPVLIFTWLYFRAKQRKQLEE